MNSKYCPDIWKNLYIRKIDHQRVSLGFCCQNSVIDVDELNWEKAIQNKRADFLADDQPVQCSNCWTVEKFGGSSKRHQEIFWYDNQKIKQDETAELIALEWNSENLCNLACITCGPIFSSRWSSEISKYPWTDANKFQSSDQNNFFKKLDLSNVKRVYFNGGEPLLSQDHVQIMTTLHNLGVLNRCEISYNTNGTVIPDQQVIDLWRKAGLIRVFISIDAIENAFEFIRWPAKWQQILDFISFIKSQAFNIIIDITCTVGIHNFFALDKLQEFHMKYCSKNHQGDPVSLNFQFCGSISHGGKVLALNRISRAMADLALQYLDKLDTATNFTAFRSVIAGANGDDQDWIKYLNQISEIRKLDWKKNLLDLSTQYHKIYKC